MSSNNIFLKKHLCTKFVFQSQLFKSQDFYSLNTILEDINNWKFNISFFINSKIIMGFIKINKNRLRNIFFKILKDQRLWLEIEKMFEAGVINISNESVYSNFDFCSFNSLSYFLFNVYLCEFDFYMNSLINQFNVKHFFFKKDLTLNNKKQKFNDLLLFPIKLKRVPKNGNRNLILNSSQFNIQFKKNIYYVRYLNYFLIALISSKLFAFKLKKRITNFLRGNLFLNLSYGDIYLNVEKNIVFLGYNISFSAFTTNNKRFSHLDLFLKKKVNVLFFKRIKFSKLFLMRFYFEFIEVIQSLVLVKKFSIFNINSKKVWLFLFQLEAIHSLQLKKLNLTENYIFFPLIQNYNKFHLLNLKHYSFSLFLTLFVRALKETNLMNDFLKVNNFLSSCDTYLKLILSEFYKKYFLLFYRSSFVFEKRKFLVKSYFRGRNVKSFKNYLFFSYDIFSFKSFFAGVLINSSSYFQLNLKVPMTNLYKKLQILGFISIARNTPVVNLYYIFLEDFYIINFCKFFCCSIISWYKSVYETEFKKLILVFSSIRESCFLTLSRKHNKSKNWAYEVYNFDLNLLYFSSVRVFYKFFDINFFSNRHKGFLFKFDELLFLNL